MDIRVSVNNESFDRAGITKDCKDAVCEYIWNGFEADATRVEVSISGGNLQEAKLLKITDNGKGIEFESIEQTFGVFLSSIKNVASIRIKSQVNKGKGRFSYLCFSNTAQWTTCYNKDGVLKQYTITTDQRDRSKFITSELMDGRDDSVTGTTVEFPLGEEVIDQDLAYHNMKQKLLQEFSWFLFLNKSRNLILVYDGIELDYVQYIDTELSLETSVNIGSDNFKINMVVG